MSDDIVARARAALEGVTEGPWEQNGINGVHTPAGSCIATTHQVAGRQRKDDARFIAASRSLVPELLAEAERLRGALDGLAEAWMEGYEADGGEVCGPEGLAFKGCAEELRDVLRGGQ